MLRPRTLKILRDLRAAYTRVIVMTIAIGVAVTGFGGILIAREVITNDAQAAYVSTNPAAATIDVASGVDDALLARVEARDGVESAAARQAVSTTVQVGDVTLPLRLFIIDESDQLDIATFKVESGHWPASNRGLVLERAAGTLLDASTGDSLTVEGAGGSMLPLDVEGTAWDPALPPSTQERTAYAFVTPALIERLGFTVLADQLLLTVADTAGRPTRDQVRVDDVASSVTEWLTEEGNEVHGVTAPPYRHPHQNQTDTVTGLLLAFAVAALALAAVLVASTLGGMLAAQSRQIGAMKTVGASTGDVRRLYLAMTTSIAVVATALAVLPAIAGGFALSRLVGSLLNIDIVSAGPSITTLAAILVAGIAVPVLVAMVPVNRAARVTVLQALGDFDVTPAPTGIARRTVPSVRVARTLSFAIRNLRRRPRRLIATVALLAVGGSLFLAGLNSAEAWQRWVDDGLDRRHYDAQLVLAAPSAAEEIRDALADVKGLESAETLLALSASPAGEDGSVLVGRVYPDGGHGTLAATAINETSELVNFAVQQGRWLQAGDREVVVLNQAAATRLGDPEIGENVRLSIEATVVSAELVGVVSEVVGGASAYFPTGALDAVLGGQKATMVRIVTADNTSAAVARAEEALTAAGIAVAGTVPTTELRSAIDQHVLVFIAVLIALATLMAVIGALGLSSAMSMSVIERTREFGVMKAVGARASTIRSLVITEGVVTGLAGLVIAVFLSVPVSIAVGSTLGHLAFGLPLPLVISPGPIAIWALLAVVGAALSSLAAAQASARLTVRESLARV